MDFVGLTTRYKVNRPLTGQEIELHLLQNEASGSKPLHQSQLIRMNSTYLECVDKFFALKGIISAGMIFCIGANIMLLYMALLLAKVDEYGYALILFLPTLVLEFFCIKLFFKESFAYTHFPIRFNRKTRKVHVFRTDGTIMTEDWEKLYFTLCRSSYLTLWEIRGHRLAEDGKTVLETFGLPAQGVLQEDRATSPIWTFWEFVRRYMEEPDALPVLVGQVNEVIDIADKREGYLDALQRHIDDVKSWGILVIIFFFWFVPLCVFYGTGRWIATHTSRIPKWPDEIEAECQIDPDDIYAIDAQFFAEQEERAKSDDPPLPPHWTMKF